MCDCDTGGELLNEPSFRTSGCWIPECNSYCIISDRIYSFKVKDFWKWEEGHNIKQIDKSTLTFLRNSDLSKSICPLIYQQLLNPSTQTKSKIFCNLLNIIQHKHIGMIFYAKMYQPSVLIQKSPNNISTPFSFQERRPVSSHSHGGRRPVKVWNANRNVRKALVVGTYDEFLRKGINERMHFLSRCG